MVHAVPGFSQPVGTAFQAGTPPHRTGRALGPLSPASTTAFLRAVSETKSMNLSRPSCSSQDELPSKLSCSPSSHQHCHPDTYAASVAHAFPRTPSLLWGWTRWTEKGRTLTPTAQGRPSGGPCKLRPDVTTQDGPSLRIPKGKQVVAGRHILGHSSRI